jgi:hypothetical protein
MPTAGRPLGLIVSTLRPKRWKVLQTKPRQASSSLTPGGILMPPLVWIKTLLLADDDETKPTALVLRPHFLCVVPMPEERIDHNNDAVERHPSLLLRDNLLASIPPSVVWRPPSGSLLDREPQESILRRFDVTAISRYFPDSNARCRVAFRSSDQR